jgi:hypothetical protein
MGFSSFSFCKLALFVVVSLNFVYSGQSKRQQIEEIAKRQLDSLLQTEDYLAVFWREFCNFICYFSFYLKFVEEKDGN